LLAHILDGLVLIVDWWLQVYSPIAVSYLLNSVIIRNVQLIFDGGLLSLQEADDVTTT